MAKRRLTEREKWTRLRKWLRTEHDAYRTLSRCETYDPRDRARYGASASLAFYALEQMTALSRAWKEGQR